MYRDETMEWLEYQSDINVLREYRNKLDELTDSRKRDFLEKGYIDRNPYTRKLHMTIEGEWILEHEEDPPYPYL